NAEQINAQQKAYAEALLEQNRAMKERIDALQKNESTIQGLQSEVERLKKELDSRQSTPPEENKETRSDDFSFWRAKPDRGEDEISDPGEIMLFPRSEAEYQAFLLSQMRLNDEFARALATAERRRTQNLLFPFRTAYHPQPTMNHLKLSLRAADDPRIIKEENGVPTFASVFALHNSTRNGREETLPITIKASHEQAQTLVNELRKGVAFVVEGQLAYYRSPETNRESYSVWAESLSDITPPRFTATKAS
ncbi:MAG: single-stranded DNA-binding protein, partial [Terrimicrobiaceae bacterium]